MNVQLLISASLILLGSLIHTIGGEITDIRQLMRSKIPTNLKVELRMSWYLAAIDMAVSGVYLLVIALTNDMPGAELLVSFTALRVSLYGVMAFLLLLITQRDHLLKTPQWILLIAIGVLAWFGVQLAAQPPRPKAARIDPFEPIRGGLEAVETIVREAPEDQHASLTAATEYLLGAGGKRIRPAVCLLTAGLLNHEGEETVLFAAAVEMLHTATLVHDDLIDGSLLRRGVPTLNANWSPATTILVGDYLFARAANLAARTRNIRITELFADTLMVILNGEIAQSFSKWQVNRQEYYKRIYAKTAAMFVLSTRGTAILAGADEETQQALIEFGHSMGMAFQIVDDVLDYIGREKQMGKPIGCDLRQGLFTLPAICYHEAHPQDSDFDALMNGKHANQDLVQRIIARVRKSSAINGALQEAYDYLARGKRALKEFPESTHKAALFEVAGRIVERAHKLVAY